MTKFGQELIQAAEQALAIARGAPRGYIALFDRSAKGAWGVVFPDLPGCVSMGDTLTEACAMAREALALHLEGMAEDGIAPPPPSTWEDIPRDPDYRNGWAAFIGLTPDGMDPELDADPLDETKAYWRAHKLAGLARSRLRRRRIRRVARKHVGAGRWNFGERMIAGLREVLAYRRGEITLPFIITGGDGFTKEDLETVSDNPELTDVELSQMRPFREVFPELAESIKPTRRDATTGAEKARFAAEMAENFDGLKKLGMLSPALQSLQSAVEDLAAVGAFDVLAEHSQVVAVRDIQDGGETVPAGATGAIVHIILGGLGYAVEFTAPAHVVVSVRREDVAPAA